MISVSFKYSASSFVVSSLATVHHKKDSSHFLDQDSLIIFMLYRLLFGNIYEKLDENKQTLIFTEGLHDLINILM